MVGNGPRQEGNGDILASHKVYPDPSVLGGEVGIWSFDMNAMPASQAREAASEIERLGYAALWLGEAQGREAFTKASMLLSATGRLGHRRHRRHRRHHLSRYLRLPNYRNSWLRQGFREEDLSGEGSERPPPRLQE